MKKICINWYTSHWRLGYANVWCMMCVCVCARSGWMFDLWSILTWLLIDFCCCYYCYWWWCHCIYEIFKFCCSHELFCFVIACVTNINFYFFFCFVVPGCWFAHVTPIWWDYQKFFFHIFIFIIHSYRYLTNQTSLAEIIFVIRLLMIEMDGLCKTLLGVGLSQSCFDKIRNIVEWNENNFNFYFYQYCNDV